jgi:hypothetical protein
MRRGLVKPFALVAAVRRSAAVSWFYLATALLSRFGHWAPEIILSGSG